MVVLRNTKPKITNTQSQKFLKQNLNFCKKPSLNFWTATNKKLGNLIIPITAKLSFLSPNGMPMKLKNYNKQQPFLIFAACNFLIFLNTRLHEPQISEKTISEFFGNCVLNFQENFYLFKGVRYTKDREWVLQIQAKWKRGFQ